MRDCSRGFRTIFHLSSVLNQRMLTLGRSSLYKHDSRESGAKEGKKNIKLLFDATVCS